MSGIHITGASGSGTTTLGAALAERLEMRHHDTDDFFWESTDPPFQRPRPVPHRQQLLSAALDAGGNWVLSGSLCGWGDIFIPRFDLVVFLTIPHELRIDRLITRALERDGAGRIGPGGDMEKIHRDFIEWAIRYDSAGFEQRSRALHERWLGALSCVVLRLESTQSVDALCDQVERAME